MRHIRSYLTSRAIATGAAVLLLGGGAALAVEGTDGGGTAPEQESVDGALEGSPATEAEEDEPPAEATEGDEAEGDEAAEGRALADDSLESPATDAEGTAPEVEDDGGERSETAGRVHAALSGDEEIGPGHPEFGARVSARARSGQPGDLGRAVSRAARGMDADEGLAFEERERPARPDRDDDTVTDRPEDAGPPEGVPPGPPAHANGRANRGGSSD